jgi:hypothetical protein
LTVPGYESKQVLLTGDDRTLANAGQFGWGCRLLPILPPAQTQDGERRQEGQDGERGQDSPASRGSLDLGPGFLACGPGRTDLTGRRGQLRPGRIGDLHDEGLWRIRPAVAAGPKNLQGNLQGAAGGDQKWSWGSVKSQRPIAGYRQGDLGIDHTGIAYHDGEAIGDALVRDDRELDPGDLIG